MKGFTMALRRILTAEDPALHKVCRPVTKFDDKLGTLLYPFRNNNLFYYIVILKHSFPFC